MCIIINYTTLPNISVSIVLKTVSNPYLKRFERVAFQYIAELSLLEADPYLQYKPSLIAASALATARHCLLCERSACAEGNADRVHPACAAAGMTLMTIYVII